MGILFAIYVWNMSPINWTDIIRSFAEIGRIFTFPFNVTENMTESQMPTTEGEGAIEHIKTMFPLWYRQLEIL